MSKINELMTAAITETAKKLDNLVALDLLDPDEAVCDMMSLGLSEEEARKVLIHYFEENGRM